MVLQSINAQDLCQTSESFGMIMHGSFGILQQLDLPGASEKLLSPIVKEHQICKSQVQKAVSCGFRPSEAAAASSWMGALQRRRSSLKK